MAKAVSIAVYVVAALISVFGGFICYNFLSADLKGKAVAEYEKLKDKNLERIHKNGDKYYAYNALKAKMLREGITYRLGEKVTPFDYVMMRIGICVAAFFVGFLLNPALGFLFLILAYVAVPLNYSSENKKDNNEMLDDIANINGVLALQVKNGVYITNVVYECYRVCKNKRLKKALLELSVEIDSVGISKAVDGFMAKFDNPHVNMFGKCIKQVDASGQAEQFFKDLGDAIDSINKAITIKEEQKAKTVGGIFQTLSFIAAILFAFYVLYISTFGGMDSLF